MGWISVSTLPYGFDGGSAVVLNDEIHILGPGVNHYKYSNGVWTSVSTLPYVFDSGSAVVLNDEIHILGTAYSTEHYKYSNGVWTSVSTLPYEFYYGSAVVLNDEIHILGGYDAVEGSGRTSHYKYSNGEWTSVSTLPYDFYYGSAVVLNDEIHILGSASAYSTEHYKYSNGVWTSVSTLPYGFYGSSAIVLNDEIHILGSGTNHYKYSNGEWTSVSTLPYGFYSGSAVVLNDEIHILGSQASGYSTDHYKYVVYINKVIFGSEVLIDLTADTVTENDVLTGVTFHDASGEQKTGNYNPTSITPSDSTPPSIASGEVIKAAANGYLTESCYKRGIITTGLPTGQSQTYTLDTGLSTITELWVWINCSGNYENKAQLFVRYNSADGNNCYSIEGYQSGSTSTGQAGFFAFGASNIRATVITAISGGSVTLRTGSQSSAYGNWSELRWMAR